MELLVCYKLRVVLSKEGADCWAHFGTPDLHRTCAEMQMPRPPEAGGKWRLSTLLA